MNFKKRVNGSWTDTPHYIHNTSTDTLTNLPADIYANDTTATVGLKGQMEQSSTPSPTTPIQPQECGEITANILTSYKENYSINASGVETYNDVAMIYKAEVAVTGSTFTLDFGGLLTGDTVRIHAYTGDTWQEQINAINIEQVPFSFTVGSNIDNIRISIRKTATDVTMTDGQYKIPILSASTTTPVYLGQVQSTRRIRKLVLTGDENWNVGSANYYTRLPSDGRPYSTSLCTHAKNASTIDNNGAYLYLQKSSFVFETLTDFKSYLAAQYAAGTPVTVWYVLANEETGIVNEPIRKIGNYADTVSGITIPTIAGANSFDVLTTLKPSEVSLAYTGWHDATVKEWDGSEWQ